MTRPPCNVDGVDCPRRYVGCRAGCDEWHKWLAIHAEEKERVRRGKAYYNDVEGCLAEQNKRAKKNRHRMYVKQQVSRQKNG